MLKATNTTKARRALILKECNSRGVDLIFVESICEDNSAPSSIHAHTHTNDLSAFVYLYQSLGNHTRNV
jgi:hypothetical protein